MKRCEVPSVISISASQELEAVVVHIRSKISALTKIEKDVVEFRTSIEDAVAQFLDRTHGQLATVSESIASQSTVEDDQDPVVYPLAWTFDGNGKPPSPAA